MRSTKAFLGISALLLFLAAGLPAQAQSSQDTYEGPTLNFGGLNTQGSASIGYRFTDVKGYRPMYRQIFNLRNGPRLMDFQMFGEAKEGAHPLIDNFSINASGLGGDPFPTVQFNAGKTRLFDFRGTWRQAYFFVNPNDDVVMPIAAAAGLTGNTGLTDHHDWSTVRKFGSFDFSLYATSRLRFNFEYYRTTQTGPTYTTRTIEFPGSPSYWGGFARGNPYYLFAPLNDDTNRFTGGVDYTYNSWTFHYSLGYQTFTENMSLSNVTSPQLSIDNDPTYALDSLSTLSWDQYRKLNSPISEFSFVGKPLPRLDWHGGYIFYRYSGPATFVQQVNGVAPNGASPSVDTPYTMSQSGDATVSEPMHIITQGLTYHFTSWWGVTAEYRYSRETSRGIGSFQSLFSQDVPSPGTTLTTSQENLMWRIGLSDLDVSMDFAPFHTMVVRPGVRFMKADVVSIDNGVVDPPTTLRTKTAVPEISVGYAPSKVFTIRGDLHAFDNGASYTAVTPHTQIGGHLMVRIQPFPKLSIEDEMELSNSKLAATNFRNNIRNNATTVSYSLNDRFSIFGGFSYINFYSQGQLYFQRGNPAGTTPLLTDKEYDRVWQGGLEVKPTTRFGLRFTGNYDRSNGVGQISGEPPQYGPVTWPFATGTLFYNFPVLGRLSVDMQRTYYAEQIVRANNFSANVLTVRWTRDF